MRKTILEKMQWSGEHLILPGQTGTITRVFQFSWCVTNSAVLPWYATRFAVLNFVIGNRSYTMPPPKNARIEPGVVGELWNLLWDGLPEKIKVERGQMSSLQVQNTSDEPSGFAMVFGGYLL